VVSDRDLASLVVDVLPPLPLVPSEAGAGAGAGAGAFEVYRVIFVDFPGLRGSGGSAADRALYMGRCSATTTADTTTTTTDDDDTTTTITGTTAADTTTTTTTTISSTST
jgi:hypothetical protein